MFALTFGQVKYNGIYHGKFKVPSLQQPPRASLFNDGFYLPYIVSQPGVTSSPEEHKYPQWELLPWTLPKPRFLTQTLVFNSEIKCVLGWIRALQSLHMDVFQNPIVCLNFSLAALYHLPVNTHKHFMWVCLFVFVESFQEQLNLRNPCSV